MLDNEDILKSCVAGTPTGDLWPYSEGDEEKVEGFLKSVVADLARSRLVEIEAEFGHYGSGYASYVDVLASRKDGDGIKEDSEGTRWALSA